MAFVLLQMMTQVASIISVTFWVQSRFFTDCFWYNIDYGFGKIAYCYTETEHWDTRTTDQTTSTYEKTMITNFQHHILICYLSGKWKHIFHWYISLSRTIHLYFNPWNIHRFCSFITSCSCLRQLGLQLTIIFIISVSVGNIFP